MIARAAFRVEAKLHKNLDDIIDRRTKLKVHRFSINMLSDIVYLCASSVNLAMTDTRLGRIKAVLFDLDGTLVDTAKSQLLANTHVVKMLLNFLHSRNVHISEQSLLEAIEKLSLEMDLKLLYNRDAWWNEIFKKVNLKGAIPSEFARKLTLGYWSKYTKGMVKYGDAAPTLKYLKDKGYKLGLVTDTDGTPGIKPKRISRSSILRLFDVVVIAGEETDKVKPNPSSYLLALRKLQLKPPEAVYVGDKPFTDIKGAKALGIITVLIRRKPWKEYVKPDFTIDNLIQLKSIL